MARPLIIRSGEDECLQNLVGKFEETKCLEELKIGKSIILK
jgi:hypothetical protein